MTREEEIKQVGIEYAITQHHDKELQKIVALDFIAGAKWADKTIIEKACDYLLDYIKNFDFYTESDVETFRKAMEE